MTTFNTLCIVSIYQLTQSTNENMFKPQKLLVMSQFFFVKNKNMLNLPIIYDKHMHVFWLSTAINGKYIFHTMDKYTLNPIVK